MSPHPTDLSLERLLKREARPPGEHEHLHCCDACWTRWLALHEDESWPAPTRSLRSTPPPSLRRLPWMVSVGSAAVALAALTLLAIRPSTTQTEVLKLEEQIDLLQAEVSAVDAAREPLHRGEEQGRAQPDSTAPLADSENRAVGVRPSAKTPRAEPPAREDRDVHGDPARAATVEGLRAAQDEALPMGSNAIAGAVDQLVERDGIEEEVALTVQDLLEDELDETWRIKEATAAGDLSTKEAWADWKLLRSETDSALLELLEPGQVKTLRQEADAKDK
jgi:hypothetical protein